MFVATPVVPVEEFSTVVSVAPGYFGSTYSLVHPWPASTRILNPASSPCFTALVVAVGVGVDIDVILVVTVVDGMLVVVSFFVPVLSCEQAVTKITVSTRKREVKIFFILYLLILRVCDRLHIVLWSICLNSVCKLFVALKAEKHHLNVKQFLVNSKAGTLLVCKESCNSVVIHNF